MLVRRRTAWYRPLVVLHDFKLAATTRTGEYNKIMFRNKIQFIIKLNLTIGEHLYFQFA